MSETTNITPQLNALTEMSQALGYSQGRSSLRAEILNLIKDNYNDASDDAKAAYLAVSQLLLDSFNRDVPDGETQS
jgi:hypothetical protein